MALRNGFNSLAICLVGRVESDRDRDRVLLYSLSRRFLIDTMSFSDAETNRMTGRVMFFFVKECSRAGTHKKRTPTRVTVGFWSRRSTRNRGGSKRFDILQC